MSKNYAIIIQFVLPLMTFYRSGAQKSNVYKRDAFVTSWRFHNRAWQPQRDDRLSETSGTLWIHRGALTNQRCSLATGCGINNGNPYTLKQKYCHLLWNFVTDCTTSCQNYNFQCSQGCKCYLWKKDISVSVKLGKTLFYIEIGPRTHIQLWWRCHRCKTSPAKNKKKNFNPLT